MNIEFKQCSKCGRCSDISSDRRRCGKCADYQRKYRENDREHSRMLKRKWYYKHQLERQQKAKEYYTNHRSERLIYNARYNCEHPEIRRKWKANNRDRNNQMARARRASNKEYHIQYNREYRARKREHIRDYCRSYYTKNRDKLIFAMALRARARKALRCQGQRKAIKTIEMIGCSIHSFRRYIESRFVPGMSWDNYAKTWVLDHIIPCALFDLSKPEHQKACFHFSNYQPLFIADNMAKSDWLPDGRRARHIRDGSKI